VQLSAVPLAARSAAATSPACRRYGPALVEQCYAGGTWSTLWQVSSHLVDASRDSTPQPLVVPGHGRLDRDFHFAKNPNGNRAVIQVGRRHTRCDVQYETWSSQSTCAARQRSGRNLRAVLYRARIHARAHLHKNACTVAHTLALAPAGTGRTGRIGKAVHACAPLHRAAVAFRSASPRMLAAAHRCGVISLEGRSLTPLSESTEALMGMARRSAFRSMRPRVAG
jgi:hypothetical protein